MYKYVRDICIFKIIYFYIFFTLCTFVLKKNLQKKHAVASPSTHSSLFSSIGPNHCHHLPLSSHPHHPVTVGISIYPECRQLVAPLTTVFSSSPRFSSRRSEALEVVGVDFGHLSSFHRCRLKALPLGNVFLKVIRPGNSGKCSDLSNLFLG